MKRLAFLFVLLVTGAVLAGACGLQPGGTQQEVGKLQLESKSVDPQNAQSACAKLQMGAGELNVAGGADQLMEGGFSYNVADWKPKVSYDVSGNEGDLVVKQGSGGQGVNLGGKARNEWDIRLNDEVPTDLVVHMGAGERAIWTSTALPSPGSTSKWGQARPRWISRATTRRTSRPAYRAVSGRPRSCCPAKWA